MAKKQHFLAKIRPPADPGTPACPSEPQECHIKMGSWTYDANHINITTMPYMTEKMELTSFSINSRYVVTSQEEESIHSKVYDCCPEAYMHVDWR